MARLYTASGTKVFIAPAQASEPANAAAYAALTWTEITGIESVGEFGDESSIVTGAAIGDGRINKAKGARDAGGMSLVVFPDPEDDGQLALIAAEATNLYYPIKVEEPNKLTGGGTNGIDYFMGLVSSKRKNIGNNDNIVRRTFNIAVTSKVTEVVPT
jgi:hypothetical protein